MAQNNLDLNKPIKTIDGRPVKILAVLQNPQRGYGSNQNRTAPIVFSTVDVNGKEYVTQVALDGKHGQTHDGTPHPDTLVNLPDIIESKFWVNVYRDKFGHILYNSEESAYYMRKVSDEDQYIATIPVTLNYTVPHGTN